MLVLAFGGCGKKDTAKTAEGSSAGSATGSGSAIGSAAAPGGAGSNGAGSGAGSANAGSGSGAGSAAGSNAGPGSDVGSGTAEEAARRKDKKTGLGAPDEKPEVIVEDLLREIASGKVSAKRFVDPKRGVVERISMPGGSDKPSPEIKKRSCNDARATAYIKSMVAAETKGKADELHQISCLNEFAAKDDPDFGSDEMGETPAGAVPMKQVTCVAGPGGGEYDEIFHVVFVPDAERGFRIAAVVSTEQGANTGKLWFEVATEIASPKPCK